jgi:hypothetical protein
MEAAMSCSLGQFVPDHPDLPNLTKENVVSKKKSC